MKMMAATATATASTVPVRWHAANSRFRVQPQMKMVVKAFDSGNGKGKGKRNMDRVWREAWQSANDGFERLLFEAKKTAERIDRRYSLSRRLSSVASAAAIRAREIDREFEIGQRYRTFTFDFQRNWPKYRKELKNFLDSPLGKSFATLFFIWFALSGWLFRIFIIATWVLPFAGPLLIGTLANSLVIKGTCPACKMQFAGYKNQVIRCTGCGNIVWQPKEGKGDFFSRGSGGGGSSSSNRNNSNSKSQPDIIDVDFEENVKVITARSDAWKTDESMCNDLERVTPPAIHLKIKRCCVLPQNLRSIRLVPGEVHHFASKTLDNNERSSGCSSGYKKQGIYKCHGDQRGLCSNSCVFI